MHAISLISSALDVESGLYVPDPLPADPLDGVCCVTGMDGPTVPRKALLSNTFLDGDALACPGSDRVSVEVWRAFTAQENRGKKRGFFPERQSSWIVTRSKWQTLDRIGVRAALLISDPPSEPWAAYVTTSYKKHGALRAPVNAGGRGGGVWLFEGRRIDCTDRERARATWERLRDARMRGVPRPVIEKLDAGSSLIARVGLLWWMDFEDWARPLIESGLYQFCTYLLPSEDEIKQWSPS